MREAQGGQPVEVHPSFTAASGDGLVFQAPLFRVRRGLKTAFTPCEVRTVPSEAAGTPLARALALGHRIRQAVDTGEVADFADAARVMNVSRAWVSMLVELTFLAPDLQEKVMDINPESHGTGISFLLQMAREVWWEAQRRKCESGCSPLASSPVSGSSSKKEYNGQNQCL